MPAGQLAGPVSAPAAAETGIAVGTPIVHTTTDLAAAALSVGALGRGELHYSKGTGGFVTAQAYDPPDHEPFLVLPVGWQDLYQYCAATTSLGAAVQWCAEVVGLRGAAEAVELARSSPAGAGGVVALPWLQGTVFPFCEPTARAAFVGMSRSTGSAELVRSVLESLSGEFATQVRALSGLLDHRVERVVLSGGPTRSELWNSLDASALGRSVYVAPRANAAVGAALVAGTSVGLWADANAVGRARSDGGQWAHPDPDLTARAQQREAVLDDVAVTLRPLLARLSDTDRGSRPGAG